MRGFRASRAVLNFKSARYGKQYVPNSPNSDFAGPSLPQQQPVQKLPDWLKIPKAKLTLVKSEAKTKVKKRIVAKVKAAPRKRKAA
jgi:hypothetical protein